MVNRIKKIWEHRATGWFWCGVFTLALAWFAWNTPTAGKAVAVLAVAAALMGSLWVNLGHVAKLIWVLLLFGLLYIEMRAIDQDKKESATELGKYFQTISDQANNNLRQILQDEHQSFAGLLKTQQESFAKTLGAIVRAQRKQELDFSALLKKEDDQFVHEEQLTESLNGKLVPASDPTPSNSCGPVPATSILVMIGEESQHNAATIAGFPAAILANGFSNIRIDRDPGGMAVVALDIRASDHKIIARLNRDGFVVNRNNYLEMKRDRSTLQIIDEYGVEVLYVRYLNPQALAIRGTLRLPDNSTMAIGLPKGMTYTCANGVGPGGIAIEIRPR
jgi:hypothetical protein